MPTPTRPRLPTGHRQLVNLLVKGGLIQRDESGLAWVSATRSHGCFSNVVVDRIRARGFRHNKERFAVVMANGHPGKWWAVEDPEEPRQPRRKKEATA
jgi:hypothetical protein